MELATADIGYAARMDQIDRKLLTSCSATRRIRWLRKSGVIDRWQVARRAENASLFPKHGRVMRFGPEFNQIRGWLITHMIQEVEFPAFADNVLADAVAVILTIVSLARPFWKADGLSRPIITKAVVANIKAIARRHTRHIISWH